MKRILSVLLCVLLGLAFAAPVLAMEDNSYIITNPYEDVAWAEWDAYKANLHTHTTFSDGEDDLKSMAEEYYAQGYDVIANTDHGVVSKPWDKAASSVFPMNLQNIFNSHDVLSSARMREMNEGEGRGGRGMLQVPLGIEMNAATVYKNHVVGLYAGWGQGWIGYSADYRTCIAGTQRRGGISWIAHPGDYIKSESNPAAAKDPANVNFYADILRDYESCLGIEIYNGSDGPTRQDRVLWDQLLMRLTPEGRQVWAFAVDDSHNVGDIGRTAQMLFMPENTTENVRTCLESGAFLACSRRDRVRLADFTGPSDQPFPGVTSIDITGDMITLTVTDAYRVEWIADGEIICYKDVSGTGVSSIELGDYEDVITCYVRAQVLGEGGITATQAFGVDKGDNYSHPDDSLQGWDRIKWYANLYLTRNVFGFLVETVMGLFN